ncbi:hypothetical protein AB0368_33670 [Actinoplanes sp. NPDC051475]|uniref:hypothetical protein n=1 Tax=Actinoplanes sp. NPDC051475 TaxID=3157225 RepID=UPI00344FA666
MFEFPNDALSVLRDHDLLPDGHRCVFAGGSLIRGWGNATSDIDVFVVLDEPAGVASTISAPVGLDAGAVHVRSVYVDGRRWDVEYWLESQIAQLLEKVSPSEFASGKDIGLWLTPHEVDFLDKFSSSQLLHGGDWFEQWRGRLEASAYRSVVAVRALDYYDNYAEDVVGQLATGDTESAVLSAKAAFGYAIDGVLALYGEFGSGTKWRARRFLAAQPKEMSFDDYWAFETMRTFDPAFPERWPEEVLLFCRDLCSKVDVG